MTNQLFILLLHFNSSNIIFPFIQSLLQSQSSLECTLSKQRIETSATKRSSEINEKVFGIPQETEGLYEKKLQLFIMHQILLFYFVLSI